MVRSGELLERRLSPDHERVFLEWTRSLPGHAAVVYEAGPPVIEWKAMHAMPRHLARLLHLSEVTEVAIPSIEQESARDLVSAQHRGI